MTTISPSDRQYQYCLDLNKRLGAAMNKLDWHGAYLIACRLLKAIQDWQKGMKR